jgi:hypothetical protein
MVRVLLAAWETIGRYRGLAGAMDATAAQAALLRSATAALTSHRTPPAAAS